MSTSVFGMGMGVSPLVPQSGASVAEWLERAIAVREVSLSRHKKNLCGCSEPYDYVSFHRANKRVAPYPQYT